MYYQSDDEFQSDRSENKLTLKYQKIHDKFIAEIKQISHDMIATISYDNYAKIWRISSQKDTQIQGEDIFKCIGEFKINNKKLSVGFDYSKRYQQFAVCSLDSSVSLYKLGANNRWVQRNNRIFHSTSVIACNFFDKLKALCTVDMNGQLSVWSVKYLYCIRIVTGQKVSSFDFLKFDNKKVAFIKDWRVLTLYNLFNNQLVEKQHNLQIKKLNQSKMKGQKILITFCKHINIWSLNKNETQIINLICISINIVNTEITSMSMYDDKYLIYSTRISSWIPHQMLYQSTIKFYDTQDEKSGKEYIIHEGVNRTYFLQEFNDNRIEIENSLSPKIYYFTREDGSVAFVSSEQLIP